MAGGGGDGSSKERELETFLLRKVGEVSSIIDGAKHVEEVICALHSLTVLLFPVDTSLLSGVLDERYRKQVLSVDVLTDVERDELRLTFYRGAAFPTMARILIYNVASSWLACFPLTARIQIYDSFFVRGPSTEIIQAVIPGLARNKLNEDVDSNLVCSNAERLLALCLLENGGVCSMAREFGDSCFMDENGHRFLEPNKLLLVSRMAQLLTSVPDKARLESPTALSSHFFFKKIIIQLLAVAEERALELSTKTDTIYEVVEDGTFSFIGETFARICRRGSVDILTSVTVPWFLDHVRSCISSKIDCGPSYLIELDPKSLFWLNLMEHVKDPYAVERLSEELLRQLANEDISDAEAYWMLWILFHRILKHQRMTRVMFCDKFLLWKVFPVCCLRWILQFSVFECPPHASSQKVENVRGFLDTVQHLLSVWSKREFVQSASMEQQAYITAAIGLSVERMSKEELETTRVMLNSILQGVSCRLESPIQLVRKMASSIALVFSKVVDPNNPLYLDDSCSETIDWEFGLISPMKRVTSDYRDRKTHHGEIPAATAMVSVTDAKRHRKVKNREISNDVNFSNFRLIDPDEVVDPASICGEEIQDEEDDESEHSESSDDSSLQPYDLSDDDTDLKKTFSQLVDIVAALRKSDDPDGVERALDVAERLVRASPDELRHNAADLVKTLVQIRCSDLTVEGEEESAEGKRQKTLVALLVTCPFESLDVITKLLYSPNVDVSQRILIIDVMTDAAQELADTKTARVKYQSTRMISSVSGGEPWFLPSSKGPDGSSPWVDISERESPLSWSQRYERTLPSKPGQIKAGKSRRWSLGASKAQDGQLEWSKNKFPLYAAAFMLPAMQGFDRRKHGVDFLGRDFIVLGKLIHMLGVCMRCMAMHPEASALAPPLLDMLSSRNVSHHAEAYVRRSVLFAASCILVAVHPSFVAASLVEGNQDISKGLDWIRAWAFHVAESDPDTECSSLAMTYLQLHSEMALQTSRSLESADCFRTKTGIMPSTVKKDIILPVAKNMDFSM